MDTSLKITMQSTGGKTATKTYTAVNPSATDTAIKTTAQKIAALSKQTYEKAERIDTTDLDNAVAKQTPVFALGGEIDPSILTRSYCLEGHNISFSCTSDGPLWIRADNDNSTWCTTVRRAPTDPEGLLRLYIGIVNEQTANNATAPHAIIIKSAETENFYEGEFTVNILED